MRRLKASEVASFRLGLLAEQDYRCGLCGDTCQPVEAVLDHDHVTGRVRGVLHRGCNAMLGHIENNRPRHKLTGVARLTAFLRAIPKYLAAEQHEVQYPTHRSGDEKRELRNKRARAARAARKAAT